MKRFLLLVGLVVSFLAPIQGQCGEKCGVSRWAVKSLSDTTVDKIDFDKFTKKRKTVKWLVNSEPPAQKPQATRINGLEWFAFKVHAILVGYKKSSDDQDFHVVIKDLRTKDTMIVEFKDPKCSGVCSSSFLGQMRQAREDFMNSPAVLERGKVTSTYKKLNKRVKVELVGIGFWDFIHGQIGVAKNGIELHPVINYREIQ